MTRPIPTTEKLEAFAIQNVHRVCWVCAEAILDRFGGQLFGYFSHDNPTAVAGKSAGGHEFVVVANRWLVDVWASEIEGLPAPVVIDLTTHEGDEYKTVYYGPRALWTEADWRARRRERRELGDEFNKFEMRSAAPPAPAERRHSARSALNPIDLGTGGIGDSSANGDSSGAPYESRNPAGQVTAETPKPRDWPLKPVGRERAATSGDVAESRTVERAERRQAEKGATK